MEFIDHWQGRTGLPQQFFCGRLGLRPSRLGDWRRRFGQANAHNGRIPRDFWLAAAEKQAIVDFYRAHPEDGYRRCTYMMIDRDIACASPATVYRTLVEAGVMRSRHARPSRRGSGFEQPLRAHEHYHMDISYVKVGERFYFLICVLDGYSRSIVHWELRETMTEIDVGIVQQGALERFPEARPRFITDNGKQFTGREFRAFIAAHDLTHVTTSAYYPQSNGKLERFHGSLKGEHLHRKHLTGPDHARQVIAHYVDYYNHERLHSALGYVTPADMLANRQATIHAERDRKLAAARNARKHRFLASHAAPYSHLCGGGEGQDPTRISAPCGPSKAAPRRRELCRART